MSSAPVTVFIKNMTGDVLPLNVSCDVTLDEVANQLFLMDSETYPAALTHLFRFPEGEEKQDVPLQEGDVLMVMVNTSFEQRGIWSKGGQHYVRYAIPFRGKILYVYPRVMYDTHYFDLTFNPESTTLSAVSQYSHHILYTVIKDNIASDVTPEEMSVFYDAMSDHFDMLYNIYYRTKSRHLRLHLAPREPIRCACGSVVHRSSVTSHTKTKKHKEYVKNL